MLVWRVESVEWSGEIRFADIIAIIAKADTTVSRSTPETPRYHETLTDLRMALMAPFSSRDTCAWDIPRAEATSIWVLPS